MRAKKNHGMSGHRMNKIWRMMRQRCNNPSDQAYDWYGGKGIKVCQEWDNAFVPFMEWAFANGYQDGLTLDRVDSAKGYSSDNCRWVTRASNTRSARLGVANKYGPRQTIKLNDEDRTIKQWADEVGISSVAMKARLKSSNWTTEEALTTPANGRQRA